uniref:Cyclic nucleotide-binding domain-containing protein n=1 Tax=Macrostomum lignano TaxID=282301 RepID=A0A1I8FC64_9PLAT
TQRRRAFLENSYAKSERLLNQLYHRVAKPCSACSCPSLAPMASLRRGSMFVLSGEQFRRLIVGSDSGDHQQQQEPLFDSLLDLGARAMATRVFATEMATGDDMALSERGYTVVDQSPGCQRNGHRCRAGAGRSLRLDRVLQPAGQVRGPPGPAGAGKAPSPARQRRLLLAVVVAVASVLRVRARQPAAQVLAVSGPTFEEQLASLVSNVLGRRAGQWWCDGAKAPYLCEGDLYQSFYHLTDAVLLLRPYGLTGSDM